MDGEFCSVWWDNTDLANALEECEVEPTDENVGRLRDILTEDKTLEAFEEKQIEAGWNFIYSKIREEMVES